MIQTSQPFPPGSFETTDKYLRMVDQLGPAAFVELAGFDALVDGAAVEQDSRSWAARIFQPAASPWRPDPAVKRTVAYAAADSFDLIRHELRAGEIDLAITESVRFVLVGVRTPNLPLLGAEAYLQDV